jgi:NADPH:quinone reductase-like Zn-dependent oxidoreductase
MSTRSLFGTHDISAQNKILNEVADLIDANVLRTTIRTELGRINAASLQRAHALLESGMVIGKLVLQGF